MPSPVASLAQSALLKSSSSFDTFSSYGVSLNSPLASNVIGIGRQLTSALSAGKYIGSFTGSKEGKDVGNVLGDGYQLDMGYRVSIFSDRLKKRVVAFLQSRTTLQVASKWTELIPIGTSKVLQVAERALQGAGRSLVNKAMSRRMWAGSEPVKMLLTLRFEAVSNPISEVIAPCVALLQMASPGDSKDASDFLEVAKSKGFGSNGLATWAAGAIDQNSLVPPGPSPYWSSKNAPDAIAGDKITIMIGNFMTFRNVILSAAEVDLDTKIHRTGAPISATARVTFETYEVQTKSDIATVFTDQYASSANFAPVVTGGSIDIPR